MSERDAESVNVQPEQPDRAPGRPPADGAPDVRDELLDAAAALFAEHGFAGTSVRKLADRAGVNPAMVHYYFGNKSGLYQALLERVFEGLLPRFATLAEVDDVGELLTRLFDVAHGTMVPNPWIPQLLLREVLAEGGGFRDAFADRFASRVAGRITGVLRGAQERGALRDDIDPALAYVCLVGMVMFPILGRPVLEQILGRSMDDQTLQAGLRATASTLFLHGLASRGAQAEEIRDADSD